MHCRMLAPYLFSEEFVFQAESCCLYPKELITYKLMNILGKKLFNERNIWYCRSSPFYLQSSVFHSINTNGEEMLRSSNKLGQFCLCSQFLI